MSASSQQSPSLPSLGLPSCSEFSAKPMRLDQLVQHCCDCFEGDPPEPDSKFPYAFFSVSEWLTGGDLAELMALFVALFQNEPRAYGQKVCSAVGYWIHNFPVHFDAANVQLCRLLERLKRLAAASRSSSNRRANQNGGKEEEEEVNEEGDNNNGESSSNGTQRTTLDELLDISAIPSFAWLRNVSVRNPVSRHVSLCFEQWSPEDIASSMSHIDYKALSRVHVTELKTYVRLGRVGGQTPHLERSITVFNCFSGWVQATILSKSSAVERAEVINKFVAVGKHLKRQHNFNTAMAVIVSDCHSFPLPFPCHLSLPKMGGITHSNIARLEQTNRLLAGDVVAELQALANLFSYSGNFVNYRRKLRDTSQRFRIPIMGVHLKDLIYFWHSASLEQFERSRCMSERYIGQLAHLLSHFLSVNRVQPNFGDVNPDLVSTLKIITDIPYDEQQLYELSVRREPKQQQQHSAGTNSTTVVWASSPLSSASSTEHQQQREQQQTERVFADWAKGICQQTHPDTLNKHIQQMIDAVFKHYDESGSGLVSRTNFEQFLRNFSFLDSLGDQTIMVQQPQQQPQQQHNQEEDNTMISRPEMEAYFARLNGLIIAQHRWEEWHFLAPATCGNCKKLLWMRHGLRCAHCSLASHEQCRHAQQRQCRRDNKNNITGSGSSSMEGGARSSNSSSSSTIIGGGQQHSNNNDEDNDDDAAALNCTRNRLPDGIGTTTATNLGGSSSKSSGGGISSWLSATLSPRFTSITGTGSHHHQHQSRFFVNSNAIGIGNTNANALQQQRQTSVGGDNRTTAAEMAAAAYPQQNGECTKSRRRTRTSSSSTTTTTENSGTFAAANVGGREAMAPPISPGSILLQNMDEATGLGEEEEEQGENEGRREGGAGNNNGNGTNSSTSSAQQQQQQQQSAPLLNLFGTGALRSSFHRLLRRSGGGGGGKTPGEGGGTAAAEASGIGQQQQQQQQTGGSINNTIIIRRQQTQQQGKHDGIASSDGQQQQQKKKKDRSSSSGGGGTTNVQFSTSTAASMAAPPKQQQQQERTARASLASEEVFYDECNEQQQPATNVADNGTGTGNSAR